MLSFFREIVFFFVKNLFVRYTYYYSMYIYFYDYTKMNNKTSFSLTKSFVIVLLLLTGFGIFVRAGYVPIPTSIDNALQVIKRLLVTDDGTQT